MCCFTTTTEVHSTSIFARMTSDGTQALVYQMQYSAAQPTAMILPLPVALPADDASVSWKDLKGYPTFFSDLDNGFPDMPKARGFFDNSKSAVAAAAAPLPVHEVGDFVASFVPKIDDFSRLDPRFVISKTVWNQIPAYADYGFAVFQLKELNGEPHPIAFEFKTRLRDQLYFPTVHIHDGTVHAEDHFDHALYVQDAGFDRRVSEYRGATEVDPATKYVRSKEAASTFADATRSAGLLDASLLVHREFMRGMLPNRDTFARIKAPQGGTLPDARSGATTGCSRCDVGEARAPSFGPAGLALLGLGWIIRRRDGRARELNLPGCY